MSKTASDYLPQVGYWNENTGIMDNGALFAVFHITGFAADLASAASLGMMRNAINMAIIGASTPNVEVWHHFVRAADQVPTHLPECHSWFAQRLDHAYRNCLKDNLYRNDLFITVILKPDYKPLASLRDLFKNDRAPNKLPSAQAALVQDFNDLIGRFVGTLTAFGVRRLGIRKDEYGLEFQEIAEAYYYILHGYSRPIPMTAGMSRMGRQIISSRPDFGHNAFRLESDLGDVFGSVLSFMDYPKNVSPVLFDALLRAPFGFTMTNSFICTQRGKALDRLQLLEKKRMSSGDKATSQTADLMREMDELASREFVRGSHHFALTVRGKNVPDLDRVVSRAVTLTSNMGLTLVRENEAQKAAFFSQIPGNSHLRPRPGGINSRNFASFASLHNVPYGSMESRWGAPIVMLRSSADTEYALHLQAMGGSARPNEDVANTLVFGGIGAGKTTLLGLIVALTDRQNVQRIVIDKDLGLAPCVEACGGEYFVLPAGHDTGIAPLRAAENTPEWRTHLQTLIIDLIKLGSPYELTPEEDRLLKQAIELQVSMPPELRGLEGVRAMLGQRNPQGAGARLRRWCNGERLGWVFDGQEDKLSGQNLLTGFDTTQLLKLPELASPLLRHIFFRMNLRVDGSPMLFIIDEFWQAGSVDVFQDFTQDASKTGRKREIAMVLATQSPRDALNSPIAHTLKEQYPNKIFFGDEDASFMDLCGDDANHPEVPHLGCTLSEYQSVTQVLPMMKHAFLLKRPGASVVVRNDMSNAMAQVAVLSGRDVTYALMRDLQKQYGRDPAAWVPHFEKQAPQLSRRPKLKERKEVI